MTNSARRSGRPSSSAAYNVGDVVDTPDSAIKSWRYLGAGEWEPNDAVRYTTSPGGGIEFTQTAIAQAIAALGQPDQPDQYVVSDAELAAIPPRLWPVESVPYRFYRAHRGYAFGIGTVGNQLVRMHGTSLEAEVVFTFPEGLTIFDVFEGDGCILVMVFDAESKYSLYRSDDLGVTCVHNHDLGRDPLGTHHPMVWLLNNSIRTGMINGRPATMMVSYNSNPAVDAGTMVPASFAYIAVSTDQCRTWQTVNIWNYDFAAGSGVNAIRHFHTCHYDKWRDCWWIGTGDTDAQSAIIRWDGKSPGPGNVSMSSIAAGDHPGWACRFGSQRWRTVDLIVTEDWIESFTDTVDVRKGGIWRVRPDLTGDHRVNHDTLGIQHDGWSSLLTSKGLHVWCSNVRGDATNPAHRWIGIWASRNGNRYWQVGRISVTGESGNRMPRGLFELDGKIWWSCVGEAGKGYVATNIYEPRGTFREERPDFLGPLYFVDFANGNDANNGYSTASAWKTFKKCLGSSAVTYGARVMLSAGTSDEEGVNSIDYSANVNVGGAAVDTSVGIQVSGQGRDVTTVRMVGSTTPGWRGTSSQFWDVDIGSATFRSADVARTLFVDNTSQTAGKPKWTFRDVTLGDTVVGCTYTVYARGGIHRLIRSRVLNTGGGWAVHCSVAGEVRIESSFVRGLLTQQQDASLNIRNVEVADYTGTALLINANATQLPVVQNVLFGEGSGAPFNNLSTLATSDIIKNCRYGRAPVAGTPASPLPVAGILDREESTGVPFAWSALKRQGFPAGVKWGLDGRPMRKNPSIGAIEAD